jgi:hypothetical protein
VTGVQTCALPILHGNGSFKHYSQSRIHHRFGFLQRIRIDFTLHTNGTNPCTHGTFFRMIASIHEYLTEGQYSDTYNALSL